MRPIIKLALAFLVLFLVFFAYMVMQGINQFEAAAKAAKEATIVRQDSELASKIQTACLSYLTEYGRLPPSSDNQKLTAALLSDNSRHITFIVFTDKQLDSDNEMVDHWGTALQITFEGNSGVKVVSAGPDKLFETPDDIVTLSPDIQPGH